MNLRKAPDNSSNINNNYYLKVKNNTTNIEIPLKNIISDNKLENTIKFKLEYVKTIFKYLY